MTTDINKLSREERDALASIALEQKAASKARAKSFREKKKAKGFVQISIWVPAPKKDEIKSAFERYVKKITN